jgi:hypothetical protein
MLGICFGPKSSKKISATIMNSPPLIFNKRKVINMLQIYIKSPVALCATGL